MAVLSLPRWCHLHLLACWQSVADKVSIVQHTAIKVYGSCEYPTAWSLHVSTGAYVCLQTSCINKVL